MNNRHSSDRAQAAAETFGQIKLLVSFLQILSSMPVAFDSVPWPENFKMFALSLDWINLDFLSILVSPNTCGLSLSALDRLAVHSLVPPMLIVACLSGYYGAILSMFVCLGNSTGSTQRKAALKRKRKIWWEATAKMLILIVLLLYPGLANRSFSMLRCKRMEWADLGGKEVLSSDYNLFCYEGQHLERIWVAVACLVVYVVGIPVTVFCVLWRNRNDLWDASSKKHESVKFELGGLYEQYEPRYWWFELVMITNKMMMTGGLSVVESGSPLQLVFALLTMQSLLLITLKLAPFENYMDDTVAMLSSMSLSLTTLFGLALIMDRTPPNNWFNSNMVGVGIIGVNLAVIVVDVGNVILIECGLLNKVKKLAKNVGRNISRKFLNTKVYPSDGSSKSSSIGDMSDHEELKIMHVDLHHEVEILEHLLSLKEVKKTWTTILSHVFFFFFFTSVVAFFCFLFVSCCIILSNEKKHTFFVVVAIVHVCQSEDNGNIRTWGGKVPVDSNQNPNLNPHHNRVVVTSRDQLKEIKKKFGVGSSEYNAGLNDLCAHRKKKKREKVKSWAEH